LAGRGKKKRKNNKSKKKGKSSLKSQRAKPKGGTVRYKKPQRKKQISLSNKKKNGVPEDKTWKRRGKEGPPIGEGRRVGHKKARK